MNAAAHAAASLALVAVADDPASWSYDDLDLSVSLPELEGVEYQDLGMEDLRAVWKGRLGESDLVIRLRALDRLGFGIGDPADVVQLVDSKRAMRLPPGSVVHGRPGCVEGDFGYFPYAATLTSLETIEGEAPNDVVLFAGLSARHGWALELECRPPRDEEGREELLEMLSDAVVYDGPEGDPEWTDEEIEARWRRDAPAELADEMEDAIRTDHYVVLGNASGGTTFARALERNYDEIRDAFPFDEVDGQRLMPVFLFRTPDQYYDFVVKNVGWSRRAAENTGGYASADYYATFFQDAHKSTIIHEQTHQIFQNRLRLSGGGSWFQEGVAVFMEPIDADIKVYARSAAKHREHVPFRQFVTIQSIISGAGQSGNRGGSAGGNNYDQAGSIIKFLAESRFGKKGFQDFVWQVGMLPRGDADAIERVCQRVYDCDLATLEEEWIEYWE